MDTPRYLHESSDLLQALSKVEILYTDLDGTLLGPGGTLLVDGDGAPSAKIGRAHV